MIEQVLHPYNIQKALDHVIKNGGSSGVDKISTEKLARHFTKQKARLISELRNGKYQTQAILGVEIPKANGKTRMLGIPTTTERLIQQAVSQVMMLKFEKDFKASSFGFRPNKNARMAVAQAWENIHAKHNYIIDIDLKNFFDEVDHCLLLNLIYQKVKCKQTLKLIRKWLKAPIKIKGKLHKRRKGIPQGSPISPLLSNILLHELDKELDRKGLRFVRYADDFSIYTKTESIARKVKREVILFLETKLKLTINEEKSGIRKPVQFSLLGFRFVPTYIKGDRGKYQLTVDDKAWKRFKQKLKSLTRKTSPLSLSERISKINEVQRGWLNYFRGTSIYGKLKELDGWLRNRLRYCIWHDWKKPERKRKNLIRLGVDQDHAYAWSRSRLGGWAIAQSPILITTITLKRLKQKGYTALLEVYTNLNPSRFEPPYA